MTRPALLLFDLDGTLLDTGGAGQRAMRRVGRALFGDAINFDAVEFGGLLDPLIYAQAAQAGGLTDPAVHHQRFHDAYIHELAGELAQGDGRAAILPGVLELLDTIDGLACATTGLLTGNYTLAGPLKLRHSGIDPERFGVAAFGDEAPTRSRLVPLAIRRWADAGRWDDDPRRVIVIGDTPRDVSCARDNGCVAFAVATGRFSAGQLRDSGAEVVVEDLSDPAPLLELID